MAEYRGYRPSTGSIPSRSTGWSGRPNKDSVAQNTIEEARPVAPATEQVRVPKDSAELSKAVGAVLSRVLDGQDLPLDVARTLVNPDMQSVAIARVQTVIRTMQESGSDIDLAAVGESLSALDETVTAVIKHN
ncbi:MAG: hypothetical protein WC498_03440 [Candidatus Saccharimonadales bacterium]